ncbi:MAG: hypothetical protein LUQ40_07030 [Methanomicrobiales archaeon]|nr:hypothetical protein [Methanomicrobiales archaeon]
MTWTDDRARELFTSAKDRTQAHENRIASVKELGMLASTGSEDAAWALSELTRVNESSYDVKKEAANELAHAREARRTRRVR